MAKTNNTKYQIVLIEESAIWQFYLNIYLPLPFVR